MITEQELYVFIDGLARKFESTPRVSTKADGVEGGVGWGQFLDGPPLQDQIGPYGTCSGLIVRALAGRGADKQAEQVGHLLKEWWDLRNSKEGEKKLFSQTTRVALFLLALRIAKLDSTSAMLEEVRQYLTSTLRSDKMWGNYNLPGVLEDASPRLLPSAIALLAFSLFREENSPLPDEFKSCADKLEERLLGTKDLPALHIAAAAAAILAVKNGAASKKIRRHIKKWAYATQPALPELGVYFYDLEFVKEDGTQKFDRDYFIVPTEVLLGIAGFQKGAPTYLRLRAESSLAALVKNLKGFDGVFRPDNEQRISSVNQGWVALYLAASRQNYVGPGIVARVWYGVVKQRPDSLWWDTLLLVLCSGGILLASIVNFTQSTWQSVTIRVLAAVLAFGAVRVYAPPFVRKMFVGRE